MIGNAPSPSLTPSEPARKMGLAARFHLDMPLLTLLMVLCGFGLLVLYSASDQSVATIERQVLRLLVAFGIMIAVAQVHPANVSRWSPWFFLVGVLLLVAVLLVGDIGKGAQRWLNLGFMRFQPSEMLKLAVPLMLAWYLHNKTLPPNLLQTLVLLTITMLPVALIAKQPDLGTALLVASSGIFVIFLSGLRWRYILTFLLLALCALPLLWFNMHTYQQQRVKTFLDPEQDPLGSGYHIIQSKIAIGSGGVAGKGWLNGTQSHLEFLPERSTDFIFAVIAEEFGLLGVTLVFALYLGVIARGLYIAIQAQDTFGRLAAGALTLIFFVYLLVNTGMVMGLLPVVGVPLPLISYGGTSMVTLMIGFGILLPG
jgi:rod shape determining protein RodA